MPLQFGKVLEEHHAVRQQAGLFDIAHMGVLSIRSGDMTQTQQALDTLVPQDLSKLYPGKAVYTQLLNEAGGIIDDIIVYQMPIFADFPEFSEFMIICNASNTQPVIAWLKAHLPTNFQVDWLNPRYGLIALQGPLFQDVLKAAGLTPLEPLPKRFHIGEYHFQDVPVLLSRTGYTGEDGVEILIPVSHVDAIWNLLLEKGESQGLRPIGLAARDTLRLEAAYPLHGAELSESISPLEAGLEWSVKIGKASDFIGKSVLLAQQSTGLSRHFTCFEMLQRSIPRHHDLLYDTEGNPIGEVTSGSISPTLGKPIGVGYIRSERPLVPGTLLKVQIRGTMMDAQVVERPFYRR